MSDIRLDGKVVLITGASQGLGRFMANGLAQAGAHLVLTSIDAEGLEGAVAEVESSATGGRVHGIVADITSSDDCKRSLDEAVDVFGDLHVLVNNARRYHRGEPSAARLFWQSDPAYWQSAIATNVNGTFLMSHTVTPHLIARKWGRIININTSVHQFQRANSSPYGVSKAALEAATQIWARDLVGTGVTVNSLLPGGSCDTGVGGRTGPASDQLLPPEVMIPPVIWLASEQSDGQTAGRYVGKFWDPKLAPSKAADIAREEPAFRVVE
jgi:NAD(P)-dependent dehydrogenase (short-subunit alcohol dehydrogenase family)